MSYNIVVNRQLKSIASGGSADLVPIGSVFSYIGTKAPKGYLLCDGATYKRNQYPELWNVLKDIPECTGDGSTTFTTPNWKGKFIRGLKDGSSIGAVGGSTKIATANLPSHDHTIGGSTGGMSGNAEGTYTRQSDQVALASSTGNITLINQQSNWRTTGDSSGRYTGYQSFKINVSHTHTLPAKTGSSGSGTDYYQPYADLNYIIKAVDVVSLEAYSYIDDEKTDRLHTWSSDKINGALANVEWTVSTNINSDEELRSWCANHPYTQSLLYLQYDSTILGCSAGELLVYGSRDAGIVKGEYTETYSRDVRYYIEIDMSAFLLRTKEQIATKSDLMNLSKLKLNHFFSFDALEQNIMSSNSEGLRCDSVSIDGGSDNKAPITSYSYYWWNIITFGVPARLTQIATQVYFGYEYTGAIFIRTYHDSNWSAWKRVI